MELAGLVLAVPPFVFLCVDLLDRVESFRKHETHKHQLIARFGAEKARLENWSLAFGISKDDLDFTHHKPFKDPTASQVLYDILSAIYSTFDDVRPVKEYLMRDIDSKGQTPDGWHTVRRTKFNFNFKTLRDSVRVKGTALRWALREKKIFTEQVETLKNLVDLLYTLWPLDQLKISQAIDDPPALISAPTSDTVPIEEALREINSKLDHLHRDVKRETYKKLDEWLKSPNVDQEFEKYSSGRVDNTGDWILNDKAYLQWQHNDLTNRQAKILWIHGPPGFGKTFLCAALIVHMEQSSDHLVTYFFSSPHVQLGSSPREIVRSWISRLIRANNTNFNIVAEEYEKDDTVPTATQDTAWKLLHDILSKTDQCILVLDGYDEFARTGNDRQEFLQKLKQTITSTNTRVLLTSRPQEDIESEISPSKSNKDVLTIECQITSHSAREDIRLFAAKVVAEQLPNKPELHNELAEKLSQKSEGQFLWIKLQRFQLRPGKNRKQLLEIVEQMPHELTQNYERHWNEIQAQEPNDRDRAIAILRWACFAARPLTIEELTEALVHEPNVQGLCYENMPDKIDSDYVDGEIKRLCPVFIDLSRDPDALASRTIHIIHPSAGKFLRRNLPSRSEYHAETGQVHPNMVHHMYLAESCLRYVNCEYTWKSYSADPLSSTDRFETGFMRYAYDGWHKHKTQAGGSTSKEYERLTLQLFDTKGAAFSKWANNPRYHTMKWTTPRYETGLNAAIYLAVIWNLPHVLEHFHSCGEMDFSPVSFDAGDALSAAARHKTTMFKDLLSWGAVAHSKCGVDGSPLGAAVAAGNTEMAQALLKLDADPEARDWQGRSILALACRKNDVDMMRHLLEHNADPSGQSRFSCSPLYYVISNSDSNIAAAKLLLDYKVEVMTTDEDGWTYLHHACDGYHEEVVQLFLQQKGVDLNCRTNKGFTPLHVASYKGRKKIVCLLLKSGANVNSKTDSGWTPLHSASIFKQVQTMRSFLDNALKESGLTDDLMDDLHTSILKVVTSDHIETARLLLNGGADPDCQTNSGHTPLHTAAAANIESTQFLLDQGSKVTVQAGPTECHYQPLHSAIAVNRTEIARLLIKRGAPVNSKSRWGITALEMAIECGNLDIIEELIEAGADLDLVRASGRRFLQQIIEDLSNDERGRRWKDMTHFGIDNTNQRLQTRENICSIAQDLLNFVVPRGRRHLFSNLRAEFQYLDATQDVLFSLKQQSTRRNGDGLVCHLEVVCDGCSGPRTAMIIGNRWVCLQCPDRDYCATCKANLSTNQKIGVRECARHKMLLIRGDPEENNMKDGDDIYKVKSQDPVVREWLKDLLKRYGNEENSDSIAVEEDNPAE